MEMSQPRLCRYVGDEFWRALRPVLRDAGFVLWKYEGYAYQYIEAGGDHW